MVVVEDAMAVEEAAELEIEVLMNQDIHAKKLANQKMLRPHARSMELRTVYADTADRTRVPRHILQGPTKLKQSTHQAITFVLS